ncbi:MAG: DUF1794 domain-containing protein [Deltaproteobacteria bacterium]|nr:DUF1794 domain-containing protein [Deltaproteobacteria bacterium]
MSTQESNPLGPLAPLVGTWEGGAGTDVAPAEPNRKETATSHYRERMTFEPIGLVDNHEQRLCGLRYLTVAWRTGQADAFHQDTGYWLWDAKNEQVMRCFVVPRGVTVLAGGKAAAKATEFDLLAERGAPVFGVCSSPFLDEQFRTVRFTMKVRILGADRFSYEEDTELEIPGQPRFHHTDGNTLQRVPD